MLTIKTVANARPAHSALSLFRASVIDAYPWLLDGTTIISCALVLTISYVSMTIGAGNLISFLYPPMERLTLEAFLPHYYPWTDTRNNIYFGYLVAASGRLYEVASYPHMPGISQWLSLFFRLFGFKQAIPSEQTAAAAALVASFATLTLQVACIYIPLRALAFSAAAAAIISLTLCSYTAFAFDFALPMSETLITYVLVMVPLLAYPMLMADARDDRVIAAVVLGGPVTLICLTLGLTVAPANAVVALACSVVLAKEFYQDPREVWATLLHDWRSRLAVGIVAALIIATIFTTKISNLYFWAVEINLPHENHPWDMQLQVAWSKILQSLYTHFAEFGGRVEPLGSRYPELIAALGVLIAVVGIKSRQAGTLKQTIGRLAMFVALILATAVMTQWRLNTGYKSATIFGLSAGALLLILAQLPSRFRAIPNLILLPLFLLAIVHAGFFLRSSAAYTTKHELRDPALELAQACRFNQKEACRCVQRTVFGPQYFLLNDIQPCQNREPVPTQPLNQVERAWLFEDAKRADVVFIVNHNTRGLLDWGFTDELVDYWRRQATCVHYTFEFDLCYPQTD